MSPSTQPTVLPQSLPPQPVPDADTQGFWEATASGTLAMCHCTDPTCGLWMMPPLDACRKCAAPTRFDEVSGAGSIYTFIIQRQAAVSGYLDNLPYVVGIIELDEQRGLRLPGRILDIAPEDVVCDMRVQATLESLPGGDYVVPVFRTQ